MNRSYFAAIGDVHGCMDKMLRLIQQWEASTDNEISFCLQVGDFEPHRHDEDLSTMCAPAKYRKLGDFSSYHQGKKSFPWPIYFIGGNHEPYGFLDLHPDGTDLCTNCRYIGRANSLLLENKTIAGLSGIYNQDAFRNKRPQISEIDKISNKHYIYFNSDDLDNITGIENVDILLLHDWPEGIIAPSDYDSFNNHRKGFDHTDVGNEMARLAVDMLEPELVLCGHMHMKYTNKITHRSGKISEVVCMSSVHQGWDSIAIFSLDQNKNIERIV